MSGQLTGPAAGDVAVPGEGGPAAQAVLSADEIAALVGQPQPTAEQRAVIEAPLTPSLVVAGAGSGKTETMAARVVWLLANGLVQPEQVLGLTFTRKAAGELAERVRRRLRRLGRSAAASGIAMPPSAAAALAGADPLGALARPTISTYNAYAASLVADHALRLGLDPGARLLGEAAQWQLAHEVVDAWDEDLATDAALSTVVEAVLSLSGALDEHLLDPATARSAIEDLVAAVEATPRGTPPREHYAAVKRLAGSLGERARVLDVVAAYRDRKRAGDAIDFGDQVALAARLAREAPEVGAGERARFAVVLLDEYQDTSYAQLTLLQALFGGGHHVTAVGDPNQSIYGWRGASAGGLDRFPTMFPVVGPDGRRRPADVYRLTTSWRNDHAILDAANRVARPLRTAAARVEVPVLDARPGAGAGALHAHVAETVDDEARAIAEYVAARWRPDATGRDRVTAAVLCRKRSQFPVIAAALREAGLPVEVVGLGGLLATPEVVDLVSALQAAHDPTRGDALMRLLTGARTRLGISDLHALAAWGAELAGRHRAAPGVEADVVDERSIVDALDDLPRPGWRSSTGRSLSPAGRERLVELAGLLRTLRAHSYLALPELVAQAERLLGLDIEVAARGAGSAARSRAQLDVFRDVSVDFVRTAEQPSLGGFLAWLEAADTHEKGLDMPLAEPNPDAVQLSTIHASKGLEWDVVAVAGLVDGVLPATAARRAEGPKDSAWLVGLGVLPYPLRGDRDDLPRLELAGAESPKELDERLKQLVLDAGEHEVAEERRLAYVAFTRARAHLLLTGAWWGDGTKPRVLSDFLTELVDDGLAEPLLPTGASEPVPAGAGEPVPGGAGEPVPAGASEPVPGGTDEAVPGGGASQVAGWAPEPAAGAVNPRLGTVHAVTWPADPFGDAGGSRRLAAERAAAWVRDAMAEHDRAVPAAGGDARQDGVPHQARGQDAAEDDWELLADRLLAERERTSAPSSSVELPPHLSASALVRLHEDPHEFARALRRPVPNEPSPHARLGTRFHAWVEAYFGSASLVDVDDLPGEDDGPADGPALDERALRTAFLASEWAARTPVAVEVDVETSVDGFMLRSRIDAVFPAGDPGATGLATGARGRAGDGGPVVIVDWKTGAPPTDPARRAAREIQLAVYRLAWSRWTGAPLADVTAAFFYVASGETVYPDRLLDEEEIVALLRRTTPAEV